MRNYLTFAGRDSRDFGVYISGQGTFSAPKKAYAFYNVPGRNGAILGNDHRLENLEVSYECFIYKNFKKNIADFRTFLLSCDGYQKLTDSYHTDEYRSAVYEGAFEPEVTAKNDAGSFTLTFSCKPQRWLTSGDTVYTFVSDSPVSIEGVEVSAFGGKLDPSVFTQIQTEHDYDGQGHYNRGGGTQNPWDFPNVWAAIGFSLTGESTSWNHALHFSDVSGLTDQITGAEVNWASGELNVTAKIVQMPKTGWELYHVCPFDTKVFRVKLSGIQKVLTCSHYEMIYESEANLTKFIEWCEDVAPVSISSTLEIAYYDSSTEYFYVNEYYNNTDVAEYETWLATQDFEIDAELSVPDVYNFTPYTRGFPNEWITITGIAGTHNAWRFILQYGTYSDIMSNPTEFPSSPLLRVYGAGVFEMDGVTVTISSCDVYTDIDCELMDCYEGSINRNNAVSFSTYDFPKLQPGDNVIDIHEGSGITVLQLIPRWWRV